ncbi:hypothetical protein [Kutzneria buriramensis]|nr:hypothetical protein [Kutzneria buriramensis]
MGWLREVTAMVIATDSPAGRVAEAIEQLTAHLPTPDQPTTCPMCSRQGWPCTGFDAAARHLQAAGVPVGYLVPLDLHPTLWPVP